ncbi:MULTISPECIES: hypothetical protein [unclassified Campylobacter]|nr:MULTISPECIES: hypothetical protein [unclassified Campylobacter]MBP3225106.1 hypothetical protein [Campylobacter sp.]MDA3042997.1 hypothetical protein [Campylobacter sp. JMF_09 ED2]MDA3044168.1 hypothetical protein [Campylobacter sp. JMF_07 ED4]MDA3057634.1 hypothetical protein [Campylobacter sp. VBCF_04 NA7]MDA3058535.1 hypothetical protein [Campylobacter sp. VBCF_05 NA6]
MFLHTFHQKSIKEKLDYLADLGQIDKATYDKILKFYALDSEGQISALIKMQSATNKVLWSVKKIDSYRIEPDGAMRYNGEFVDVRRAVLSSADMRAKDFYENSQNKVATHEQSSNKFWKKFVIWSVVWALVLIFLVYLISN